MTTLDNLSALYVTMFNNKEASLQLLVEYSAPKEAMLSTYKKFVSEGLIQPIEHLLIEEKMQLWEEVKAKGVNKLNGANAAKILHTIKFINENS